MAVKTYNIIFIIVLIILIFIVFLPISCAFKNVKEGISGPVLTTDIVPVYNKLLVEKAIPITSINWGARFTIVLNKGFNGSWQQIIGVTPYKDGTDARIFAAWLCPGENGIHLRTATTKSDNAEITSCAGGLVVGTKYTFEIISNPNADGTKQDIVAMMTTHGKENSKTKIKDPDVTQQIAYVSLDPPLYSPNNTKKDKNNNPLTNAYIFTTYNNWQPFSGTISDIVFGYTSKLSANTMYNTMTSQNLRNAISNIQGIAVNEKFTTMNNTFKEGLDNIGGIGDNAGIKPISPPTNSVNAPPALNYKPIKSEDGLKDLCAKSVVQPSDYNFNWISQYNYNYPIKFNSKDGKVETSVPICSPDELYTIQTLILKKLNTFNADYSDYMTFLYNSNHNVPGDTSPQLPYASGITQELAAQRYGKLATTTSSGKLSGNVQNLDTYKQVTQDIDTYNNLLKANKAYYPDPEKDNNNKFISLSRMDPIILKKNHEEIVNLRNELDIKLFELNNVQNSAAGESKMQMDSSIYVTILWTTLATSIIYFMFV